MIQADLAVSGAGWSASDVDQGHSFAAPRAKLTARAVAWAVDALRHDDTTVTAIAHHLGVAWDTCWSAINRTPRHSSRFLDGSVA